MSSKRTPPMDLKTPESGVETPEILTRGGSRVIFYAEHSEGSNPVHGAYWTGEEWLPVAWTTDGLLEEGKQSSLDIDYNTLYKAYGLDEDDIPTIETP
jgi:hypothetical protein